MWATYSAGTRPVRNASAIASGGVTHAQLWLAVRAATTSGFSLGTFCRGYGRGWAEVTANPNLSASSSSTVG